MIALKKESAPAKKRSFVQRCQYHVAALLADLFGQPFWFWEQRRSRLLDHLSNEEFEL